ncbi:phytanoyl-CoA dioxygenase family protein [Mesorhizobium sp. IMUNJ 23232]|uniref:phytanoyl-CoA dioxygenase family protein n=1 Tax=Mesorhizobium sp. IMUNJ 23232 TaxID=3376064 RepID=UPI003799560B
MITADKARDAVEQYREEGFAIVRGFVDGDELEQLKQETQAVYEEGLKHHATYRHGNLNFQILPEADFGKRYVLQAYWFSWINAYFERFRRDGRYLTLLEGLIGRDIKQIAQQLHWKPPGANLTGYRFHQDLRFRKQSAFDNIAEATVTTGLAVDRATKENGCLQVVPGSHKLGYLGLSDEGTGELMKGLTAEDELKSVGIDPGTIVSLELEPGDLAMWGLLTVHGSAPNRSEHDRAFALSSYVRADTTQRGEWAFRDGVSTPLGDTPKLCKYEKLYEEPGPLYDTRQWWK